MSDALCLRIKRKGQTLFINTKASDKIYNLKGEIILALGNDESTIPESMRLYTKVTGDDSSLLPDAASIADHESIKDDSVIYLVLKNGGDWESIDIMEPPEE